MAHRGSVNQVSKAPHYRGQIGRLPEQSHLFSILIPPCGQGDSLGRE